MARLILATAAFSISLFWAVDSRGGDGVASQQAVRSAIEKSLPLLISGATGHRENRFADRLHVGNRRRLWITGVSVTMWNRKKPQSDLIIIRRFTNVVNPLATICGPHKAFSCLGCKPVWVA